jgi:hypothetical protein
LLGSLCEHTPGPLRLSIVPEFASRLGNSAGCTIPRQTLGLGVRVAGLLSGSGDAEPAAGAGAAAAAEGALWRHGDMETLASHALET